MVAVIYPSVIHGKIIAPVSKSTMQRACALGLLNNGLTVINHPGNSRDELAAIQIIKDLGAGIYYDKDSLVIKSSGKVQAKAEINCGESGLALRMFAPIVALSTKVVVIKGEGSLRKRPVHFIDEVFPLLKINTTSINGFLPLTVQGPLVPADIEIDGSASSQYLTGLLFALASVASKRLTLTVRNLVSKPYVDLSLQMLMHFGYKVNHINYEIFQLDPVDHQEKKITYHTEADWSGAAFQVVAAAIGGFVGIAGLNINSLQGDKAILAVLKSSGAVIESDEINITVRKAINPLPFNFDATDCPDLFPPLAAWAAHCHGVSVIRGTSRLKEKESNRAESLKEVFSKMGIKVLLEDDEMIIHGGTGINPAHISSYQDHRIAMSVAVAAINASGPVTIEDAEVIEKSYPAFFKDLSAIGAAVSLI